MDIGEPQRVIEVEPLREPAQVPEPSPEPEKEPAEHTRGRVDSHNA